MEHSLRFLSRENRKRLAILMKGKLGTPFVYHLKISEVIQVTKTLSDPEVKKREFRGLFEAMDTYQLSEGLILTMDEEGCEEIDGEKKIKIVPTWKWLLS